MTVLIKPLNKYVLGSYYVPHTTAVTKASAVHKNNSHAFMWLTFQWADTKDKSSTSQMVVNAMRKNNIGMGLEASILYEIERFLWAFWEPVSQKSESYRKWGPEKWRYTRV